MLNSRQNNYIEKLLSTPSSTPIFHPLQHFSSPFIKQFFFFFLETFYSYLFIFFLSPCLPLFHNCMSQLIDLIYSPEYETNTLIYFFSSSSFFFSQTRKIKSNFSDVYALLHVRIILSFYLRFFEALRIKLFCTQI